MSTYPTMKDTPGKLTTSTGGAQPLWQSLSSKVPNLDGKRVLAIHCGDGWFCRQAINQGAIAVLGVSAETRAISDARAIASSDRLRYRMLPDADIQRLTGKYDVVTGIFDLQKDDFSVLSATLCGLLAPQGRLIATVSVKEEESDSAQSLIRGQLSSLLSLNALYQINDKRLASTGRAHYLLSAMNKR